MHSFLTISTAVICNVPGRLDVTQGSLIGLSYIYDSYFACAFMIVAFNRVVYADSNSKVTKTQQISVSGDYTPMKTELELSHSISSNKSS